MQKRLVGRVFSFRSTPQRNFYTRYSKVGTSTLSISMASPFLFYSEYSARFNSEG